jgi:hypothetical protein
MPTQTSQNVVFGELRNDDLQWCDPVKRIGVRQGGEAQRHIDTGQRSDAFKVRQNARTGEGLQEAEAR